ncbi:MAG: PQQ-dependent sugar dehydrogenase [Acidobacteria bacterium]|nr:PQQ-dependent sugar dehydrogenase [Acidobacteriota bacterium]
MSALAWPVWRIVAVFVLTASAPSIQNACRDTGSDAEPDRDDRVVTASDGTRVRVEVVATGLEVPWSLAFVPDGRLLVTERPGRVRVLANGRLVPEPALALDDVYANAEAGTMGIAVDPRFEENGLVYLLYTRDSPGRGPVNRVVRYREVGNVLAEATVLLDEIPASFLHDGGRIRFGPDGLLYVTMGDVLEADDAQDLAAMTGKILRIDRHGRTPPGNPYASPVYSWGHRNPQGIDWHPLSGALWATEHGNVGNDEVNRIEAGVNYGWPVIEGERTMPGMEAPVRAYSPSIAPSGASFYTGTAIPGFRNDLFFAALRGAHLRRLRFDPADPTRIVGDERLLQSRYGRLRDVVTGPDGALYVLTSNRDGRGSPSADDDRILRLVPAG